MKPRSIFAVVAVMALVIVAVPVFDVDLSDATGTGTNSGTGTGTTEPAEYSGTCGTNLNWTYKDNVLTISGTGTSLNGMGSWVVSGSNSKISSILDDDFTLKVTATKLTTLGTVFKGSDVGSIEFSYAMTIPSSGFEGCKNLTKIDLSKVTSIGASAFNDCTKLKTVDMPLSTIKLEPNTFKKCTSLTTISLTKVTSIGDYCFAECTSLKVSDIPSSIVQLGTGCFKGCTSFDKVTFGSPSSSVTSYVKNIPVSAFDGCSRLNDVILNDKIESIEKNAFRGTKLVTVNLNNVKEIDHDAFADTVSLKGFVVSSNNAAFYVDQGKYLYSKDKTTLYMVANSETGTLYADDLESSVQTIYLGYAAVTFILDDTKDCYTFKIGASTPKAIGILYSTQGVDGTISPIISSGKLSATYKLYDGWVSDKYVVKAYKAGTGDNEEGYKPADVKLDKLADGKNTISFSVKPGEYYEVLPVGAKGVTEDQLRSVTNIDEIVIGSVAVSCDEDPSTGYITKLFSYTCKVTGFTGAGKATISGSLVTDYGVECKVIEVTGDSGYPNMTELIITDDLDISAGAFADSHKLITVRLDKADSIGERMFRYCTSLKTVDAPMCKTIGKYAFEGCSSLESPVFAVVETVDDTAFINSGADVLVVDSDSTMTSAGDLLLIKMDLPCKVSFDMDGDMLVITDATSLGSVGYAFSPTGEKTTIKVYKGGFTAFPVGSEDVVYFGVTSGTNEGKCMVVMDTMLGGNITPVSVDSGKKLSEVLVSSVMDGYTFKGWSVDPDSRVAVDTSKTVSTSTVYYAIWEADGSSPNMLMYTIVSLAVSLVASVLIMFLGTRTR